MVKFNDGKSLFTALVFLLIFSAGAYSQTAAEYFYSGNQKSDKGDYAGAIDDYSRSIALEPSSPGTYNNRGNAYFALNKLTLALDDYTKSIELKPDFSTAYNNRGKVNFSLKNYNDAIDDFTKAGLIFEERQTE